jgi:hypothetical protein
MISLEEYKKALGEELLKELSEEQILKLRNQQEQMAEIFFTMWLEKINKK